MGPAESSLSSLAFDAPNLFSQLEAAAADPSRYDELRFGIVAMHAGGDVWAYNTVESEFSGIRAERVLAANFFSDIAPCTNNYLVAGRFEEYGDLDETIDYVFTLKMRPTAVRLRMLKAANSTRQYLAVERV